MLISNVKSWWQVAKPKAGLFVWQIIFSILEKMSFVLVALPSAKIISCISIIDYSGAKLNILFVVLLVLFYCIFASINSKLNSKQIKYIFLNCERLGLEKIMNANATEINQMANQKIINIMTQNIKSLAEFCGELSATFGFFAQLLFILILLFSSNLILGSIVLGISVFCLLIYNLIAFFEDRATKNENNARDQKLSMLDDIIEGRNLATDLNLESELAVVFKTKSEFLLKTASKATHLKNVRELWLYLLWNILVGLATLYMVNLLRLDFLTLTFFLLCLPYLNEALERTMNCYLILYKARVAKASANRVSTLLNLNKKEIIAFGNNLSDNLKGDLIFTNVCYHAGSVPLLNHLSFGLSKGDVASFIFENANSKQAFCDLLRRLKSPTIGTITLDSINIYDFSKSIYSHNLTTITQSPFFFQNTIYENLKVANASKKQIYSVLKQLKIYEQIVELPQGVNAYMFSCPNSFLLYELSIARAMLTQAEILLFIDIPTSLSPTEQTKLTSHLNYLSKSHTIIIATDYLPTTPTTKQFIIKRDGKLTHPKK